MDKFSIDTPEYFRMLYSNYYKAMMLYALKISNEEAMAEDIVQNAFLKLWENRKSIESESKARSFLYLHIRQRSIDHLRHNQVEEKYRKYALEDENIIEKEWEDEEVFNNELYRRLFKAIDELPTRQREIFLSYMKGKKNAEIAKAMNITEETIRVQRKRALQTLREKLGDKEMALLLLLASC